MANIIITIDGPLVDAHRVTFKAPCDCTTVEYLDVRYVKGDTQASKLFTMKDAHGNALTGLGNLFAADAYVHAILDPKTGSAYLQNAATNAYLEGKMNELFDSMSGRFVVLSGYKTIQDGQTVDVQVSLPAGWNFSNTMLVSAVQYGSVTMYTNNSLEVTFMGGNTPFLKFQLQGAASTNLGSSSKNYRILLYKFA